MIRLKNISKVFGGDPVLKDLTIEFDTPSISCIIGPSGCGKTTLLKIMADLLKEDKGTIYGVKTGAVSFVFQDPLLLPWKTVLENVLFPIREVYPVEEARDIAMKNLSLVKLRHYTGYYPGQLSNGMKQRVAIARALSFPAGRILMDEPFSSLDVLLKEDIMRSVKEEIQQSDKTLIFVSHDPDEAVFLSDRIFVFRERPLQVYQSYAIPPSSGPEDLKGIRKAIMDMIRGADNQQEGVD